MKTFVAGALELIVKFPAFGSCPWVYFSAYGVLEIGIISAFLCCRYWYSWYSPVPDTHRKGGFHVIMCALWLVVVTPINQLWWWWSQLLLIVNFVGPVYIYPRPIWSRRKLMLFKLMYDMKDCTVEKLEVMEFWFLFWTASLADTGEHRFCWRWVSFGQRRASGAHWGLYCICTWTGKQRHIAEWTFSAIGMMWPRLWCQCPIVNDRWNQCTYKTEALHFRQCFVVCFGLIGTWGWQGGSTKYNVNWRWLRRFRNDRDRRDLVRLWCTLFFE